MTCQTISLEEKENEILRRKLCEWEVGWIMKIIDYKNTFFQSSNDRWNDIFLLNSENKGNFLSFYVTTLYNIETVNLFFQIYFKWWKNCKIKMHLHISLLIVSAHFSLCIFIHVISCVIIFVNILLKNFSIIVI